MATLLVQEAMGFKVDREAVATAVLPQLWQMAMGPCVLHSLLMIRIETDRVPCLVLNIEQFHKFMSAIKKLGDRVEREHDQFLRDSQRLEDRSTISISVPGTVSNPVGGEVNFENLVGRGDGVTVKQDTVIDGSSKGWDEDDVWGSIFSSEETVGLHFFPYVQVYRLLLEILGVHTHDAPSTSHANDVLAVNSDSLV